MDVVAVEVVHLVAGEPVLGELALLFAPEERLLGVGAFFPSGLEVEQEAPFGEFFGRVAADGKLFVKEVGHFFEIESFGIEDGARDIGEGEEFGGFGIVFVEVEDFVAGDIAVGTAGDFNGEAVFVGVDAEKEKHFVEIDVDAVGGDAKFFVVDAGAWFTAHEGAAWLVMLRYGVMGDPDDHFIEHVFIGAEIDVFGPLPVVDDRFGARSSRRLRS